MLLLVLVQKDRPGWIPYHVSFEVVVHVSCVGRREECKTDDRRDCRYSQTPIPIFNQIQCSKTGERNCHDPREYVEEKQQAAAPEGPNIDHFVFGEVGRLLVMTEYTENREQLYI